MLSALIGKSEFISPKSTGIKFPSVLIKLFTLDLSLQVSQIRRKTETTAKNNINLVVNHFWKLKGYM